MEWTEAERDQVRAAILALITGQRVASVSYSGPPARSVSYEAVDLDQLRAILAEMNQSLRGSTYRLGATRKGL